jgi:cytochrome b561
MTTHPSRYDFVAMILHWLTAVAILFLLPMGKWMVDAAAQHTAPPAVIFDTYQLHKSIGLSVLLLSIGRIAWRLYHPPPPLPASMANWEKRAANLMHIGFYVLILALPLTGWAMVSASPWGIPTIWFNLFEWSHIAPLAAIEAKKPVEDMFKGAHDVLGNLTILMILVHVGAALKHQFVARDNVLGRMLPRVFLIVLLANWLLPILTQAADAAPAQWVVDRATSTISFSGTHAGRSFKGVFDTWTARILFDPNDLAASEVEVRVTTASAKTGTLIYDGTLPRGEWLDSKAISEAQFRSDKIEKTGEDQFVLTGQLTLKGRTVPITLPFSLSLSGAEAMVNGSTILDRSKLDIGQKSDPKAEWVSNEIRLDINLRARAERPGQ